MHNGLPPRPFPADNLHIVGGHRDPGKQWEDLSLSIIYGMINAFCLFCVYLSDSYPGLPQADFARLNKIRYVGSHVIIIHVQYAQYGINQHNKKSRGSTYTQRIRIRIRVRILIVILNQDHDPDPESEF